MKYRNFTPHPIRLNDGREFPSEGIARVGADLDPVAYDFFWQEWGQVEGLPDPEPGVFLIVSALVFARVDRADVVAPATGHPDARRDEKGRIVSVPGFVVHAGAVEWHVHAPPVEVVVESDRGRVVAVQRAHHLGGNIRRHDHGYIRPWSVTYADDASLYRLSLPSALSEDEVRTALLEALAALPEYEALRDTDYE